MSNAATSEPKPPRPPLRWRRAIASALASLVFAIALLLALSWWIVGSTSGTAWLLHLLPGITVTAPMGSLVGDFSAERVEIALPGAAAGAGDRIVVSGLRWRGLSLAWPAAPTAWLRVDVESLHGDRVDVLITPDPD